MVSEELGVVACVWFRCRRRFDDHHCGNYKGIRTFTVDVSSAHPPVADVAIRVHAARMRMPSRSSVAHGPSRFSTFSPSLQQHSTTASTRSWTSCFAPLTGGMSASLCLRTYVRGSVPLPHSRGHGQLVDVCVLGLRDLDLQFVDIVTAATRAVEYINSTPAEKRMQPSSLLRLATQRTSLVRERFNIQCVPCCSCCQRWFLEIAKSPVADAEIALRESLVAGVLYDSGCGGDAGVDIGIGLGG